MNTEQRVLAMLNKIGNVRTAKKENLGAIEDAVDAVKLQLKENGFELELIVENLNEEINNVVSQMQGLVQGLDAVVQEHKFNYEAIEIQFDEASAELDSLGIGYDTPFPDLSYEYNSALNYALKITKLDLQ
jgi:hypothetical protein